MIVNIALLTVTDTRTIDNDKSGAILVNKITEATIMPLILINAFLGLVIFLIL